VLVSYAFDGHTVSEGSRPLTTAIDLVHVVAASVWAGGLFLVASVLWRRRRRGDDPAALELAARFSVVAAAALVAAGLSGVVLAWTVLDSPGDLWRTPWGRLLLVKVALVAVAAGIGAYNRQVLLPDLERDPEGRAPGRFRTAVTVEAGALGVVVAVTAFLVGAAA
jgi:putative copper export protein